MSFQPRVSDSLLIDGIPYTFAAEITADGELGDPPKLWVRGGSQPSSAIVYKLVSVNNETKVLKVFPEGFRKLQTFEALNLHLGNFVGLRGLLACSRLMLTLPRHATLIIPQHPELMQSALIPWIDGPTWAEVIKTKRKLTRLQSLALAHTLAEILWGLEEARLAHCNLSASNILLPGLAASQRALTEDAAKNTLRLELVDLEQFYSADSVSPGQISQGSPGYTHPNTGDEARSIYADRFSGAVLIVEMLCWFVDDIQHAAGSESFLPQEEIQGHETLHYDLLSMVLRKQWGDRVANMLQKAWDSLNLNQCHSFEEWLKNLPHIGAEGLLSQDQPDIEHKQVQLAEYKEAMALALPGSTIHKEFESIIASLSSQVERGSSDYTTFQPNADGPGSYLGNQITTDERAQWRLSEKSDSRASVRPRLEANRSRRSRSGATAKQFSGQNMAVLVVIALMIVVAIVSRYIISGPLTPAPTPILTLSANTATPIPDPTRQVLLTDTPFVTMTVPPTVTPVPSDSPTSTRLVPTVSAPYIAVVNSANLHLRSGPGEQFIVTYKYQPGTQVRVFYTVSSREWMYVEPPDGKQGWMAARFLYMNFDPAILEIADAFVNTSNLSLHAAPDELSDVLDKYPAETTLSIIGTVAARGWMKVKPPYGPEGWMNAVYLRMNVDPDSVPIVK